MDPTFSLFQILLILFSPSDCVAPFMELETGCYFTPDPVSPLPWQSARDKCISMGADLAVITSHQETLAVTQFLRTVQLGMSIFQII